MKKILTLFLAIMPLFVFSQWKQIGNNIKKADTSFVRKLSLNNSGNILVSNYGKYKLNGDAYVNTIRTYKLSNNSWNQIATDITMNSVEQKYNYNNHYSANVNSIGDTLSIVTYIYGIKDHYSYIKRIINQIYSYDENNWKKIGIPHVLNNKDGGNPYSNYKSNMNTIVFTTIDDTNSFIHTYEYKNGEWIKKGDKITHERISYVSLKISLDGNTIITSSFSSVNKTQIIDSYRYDGEQWIRLGKQFVINESMKTFSVGQNLILSGNGNRFLVLTDDGNETPNQFFKMYEYNNSIDEWQELGNDIILNEVWEEYNTIALNHSGNVIIFSEKENDDYIVKMLELKNNSWIKVPFDFYNKNLNKNTFRPDDYEVYEFKFSIDDNTLAVYNGYNGITSIFSKNTLNILETEFGKSFKISPNPSFGDTTINLGATYKKIKVVVNDITGKQIDTFLHSNTDKIKLETNYPKGLYFVTLSSEDKTASLKLVIE